jgi:hypothetical protein
VSGDPCVGPGIFGDGEWPDPVIVDAARIVWPHVEGDTPPSMQDILFGMGALFDCGLLARFVPDASQSPTDRVLEAAERWRRGMRGGKIDASRWEVEVVFATEIELARAVDAWRAGVAPVDSTGDPQ